MASGELLGMGESRRAISAILMIQASTNALDAYSALNSSPWTAESFGGDPAKAASCREYVAHAAIVTTGYALAASILAKNIWPMIGAGAANIYMYWLYTRALNRAVARESTGWDSQPSPTSQPGY